jgi:putative membrane protein
MGKLAAGKAGNPGLRAFGHQMVDDHGKANDRLKAVAEKQNMTLPENMTAKQQAMYEHLQSLSGAAFDKAYLTGMLKDHEEDIKQFQREAKSGKDGQLKSFASETLPLLQDHLNKLKAIRVHD